MYNKHNDAAHARSSTAVQAILAWDEMLDLYSVKGPFTCYRCFTTASVLDERFSEPSGDHMAGKHNVFLLKEEQVFK